MIEYEDVNLSPKWVVIKNALWLYFATFVNKISKLILVLIVAKILGPYLYGNFTYVFSIIGFFFMFSDWGLSNIFIKNFQILQNKEKLLEEIISIKIVLIIFISLLTVFGYFILKEAPAKAIYSIILFAFLLNSMKDLINIYFRAIQKMKIESISLLIENLTTVVFGILFVFLTRDVLYLALAYLMGATLGFFYSFLNVYKRWVNLKFIFLFNRFLRYIKEGTPILFLGFLGFIFFNSDHLILGYLRGMKELGYYSIVTKIMLNLTLIPSLAVTALFPFLSKISTDYGRLKIIYRKVLFSFIFSSFLLVLFLYFTVDYWFLWILGEEYKNSIIVFKILSWNLIFLFSLILLDNLLFILNKQWPNFYLTAICAVLNIILNIILIQNLGITGAAISTLLSQALNFALSLGLVEKSFNKPQIIQNST